MLILFDIDGTLLLTQGAGIKAMHDAGRELYGEHFTVEGVEFSGRLDTLIWQDLSRINGAPDRQADHDAFRRAYGRHLGARLKRDQTAKLLPGVASLVHHVHETPGVTLGLLTGNYPETGRLKIQCAGLDPDLFVVAAWGCEGGCRRDLPPIAIERHGKRIGKPIATRDVVIIGDTPHDIDCAKAHGCRSIGVATGLFAVSQLRESGADLAVSDLSNTSLIYEWMMNATTAIPQ
jgi:phosphoglycolate phosphatase-like HAD superfamily hydrolase